VYPAIADGNGGVTMCWADQRDFFQGRPLNVFAQRVDRSGGWPWGERTVYVCSKPLPNEYPDLVSDDAGGAIIAWHGGSSTTVLDYNIYAQRVYGDGRLGGGNSSAVRNRQGKGDATKTSGELEIETFPNPFNATVTISYRIAPSKLFGAGGNPKVTLQIYNMLGEEVLTMIDLPDQAGRFSVVWDGKDNQGKEVTSGIYWVMIKTGSLSKIGKLMLVR
jgi:hypothetical protein